MPPGTSNTANECQQRSRPLAVDYLVRGGATEVLEGEWMPKRLVILEFADMARLKAWYQLARVQAADRLRQRTAKSTLVAVEGIAGST